jgi:uncharacterized protein (DUF433 family)
MSELAMNIPEIYKRLNTLEQEIMQLREMLRAAMPGNPLAVATEYPYIERVPDVLSGEPVIQGTRTPVRAIVEHWRFGQSPDEIIRHLPHLRLAQVFNALAYFDDHREEIDRSIALNHVPAE